LDSRKKIIKADLWNPVGGLCGPKTKPSITFPGPPGMHDLDAYNVWVHTHGGPETMIHLISIMRSCIFEQR
jgi:hypothetical protein